MKKAEFVQRKNRFTALVDLEGSIIPVHVANSGRLKELLKPGAEVFISEACGPNRATSFDLSLVNYNGQLVSIDARIPNKVVADSINSGRLREFKEFRVAKREVKFGESRLDILLENDLRQCFYVEVKSVTLVCDGEARFPDAPTERGARHVSELVKAVAMGFRAAVVFLIQREDADSFRPNYETDPSFAEALKRASAQGVEVYAYICRVEQEGLEITRSVPVVL